MDKKRRKHCKWVSIVMVVLFLWGINVFAQGPDTLWTRTYGGANDDQAYSVQQTFDGGYIIAGYTKSYGAGDADVYLVKTDSIGDTLWTKTYGGAYFDAAYSVQQTSDSGFIVAGVKTIPDSIWTDVYGYLIKTDKNGDSLWAKLYGWDPYEDARFYSVDKTSDGGYIATGFISKIFLRQIDVLLVKTDMDGNVLWHKEYSEGYGYSVKQTSDGGYIAAGAMGGNVYLLRTYPNGDTIWTKGYGGPEGDRGYSVELSSDNGYIIVGELLLFGAPWADVYIIGTDSLGDTLWTRHYGGADYDRSFSVQKTFDSHYIVAGYAKSYGSGLEDVYLLKVDENGDTIWTKTYGWAEPDIGYCGQQTTDSAYIITGYTRSFGTGDWDILLVKTQPDVGIEEKTDIRLKTRDIRLFVQPNPFTAKTDIRFKVSGTREGTNTYNLTPITLNIYDVSGRFVRSFPSSLLSLHSSVIWDGSNGNGIKVSRGIYFVKLQVGNLTSMKKVVLVR